MEEFDIKILDDIVERTSGKYENMNYSDKINTILYCRKFIEENTQTWAVMKAWAGLDIDSIPTKERLQQKEADMVKVKNILKDVKPNLLDNINININEIVNKNKYIMNRNF